MTNPDSVLLHETLDGVRVLRLNRPNKMNGITAELAVAIIEAMEAAQSDNNVRVVGLTGEGRGFCAGADIGGSKFSDFSPDPIDDLGVIGRLALAIRVNCDKPVIAGINGMAIGGGVALAMIADIRIASSAATFNPGYARIATSPDCGLTWTLPQAIGHEQAMRFLLEQETLNAEAALRIGMVGEVAAADGFDESFINYCKKIAQASPYALRQTKSLINKAEIGIDLNSLLQDEVRCANRGIKSSDGQAAIKALFSKQKN